LLLAAIVPGIIILVLSLMISRGRQKKMADTPADGVSADINPALALVRDLQHENKFFSGVLSHDLRSPLSSIVLLTSYLKTKNEVQENNHYLELIEQSARKELDMMGNLLFLMRIGAADTEKFEKVELKSLVVNILKDTEAPATHKQLRTAIEIEDQLHLQSDPAAINLVIKNLIQQAIHYSEENQKVEIIAAEAANQVDFEIKIRSTQLFSQVNDSLFDSQQLLSPTTISTFPDNIGLYFCRKIISNYNGTIRVLGDKNEPYCRFILTFERQFSI
jgi:signal transduction histidine kinase